MLPLSPASCRACAAIDCCALTLCSSKGWSRGAIILHAYPCCKSDPLIQNLNFCRAFTRRIRLANRLCAPLSTDTYRGLGAASPRTSLPPALSTKDEGVAVDLAGTVGGRSPRNQRRSGG